MPLASLSLSFPFVNELTSCWFRRSQPDFAAHLFDYLKVIMDAPLMGYVRINLPF